MRRGINSRMQIVTRKTAERDFRLLTDWFKPFTSCLVAFSSGVDSSIVAYAAKKALGERAYAVTSNSASFAGAEREESRIIANEIGIKLHEVEQDDLKNSDYVRNQVTRCYYCRKSLVQEIRPLADKLSVDVCVDGTHIDDMQAPRPGIKALREGRFRAPLVELQIGKQQVRNMAQMAGLSNWNRPSEACLSSRIAYGQRIDLYTLRKIEEAEIAVRSITSAKIVRVRTIGTKAVIEVDKPSLAKAKEEEELLARRLAALGYEKVEIDNEGYVAGKMLDLFVKEIS